MAPEVYKDEIFDRSVDSYSFGVVLYEVGTAALHFLMDVSRLGFNPLTPLEAL